MSKKCFFDTPQTTFVKREVFNCCHSFWLLGSSYMKMWLLAPHPTKKAKHQPTVLYVAVSISQSIISVIVSARLRPRGPAISTSQA